MKQDTKTLNSFQDLKAVKEELEKAARQKQEKKQKCFEEAKHIIEQFKKSYPLIFQPNTPLPLAIGVEKELHRLHPEYQLKGLRFALSIWTKREKYLNAVITGTNRYNLDGTENGTIQQNEQEFSKALLERKLTKRKTLTSKTKKPTNKVIKK